MCSFITAGRFIVVTVGVVVAAAAAAAAAATYDAAAAAADDDDIVVVVVILCCSWTERLGQDLVCVAKIGKKTEAIKASVNNSKSRQP